MSTRAAIACKQEDGRCAAIYLHFNGFQDHDGKVLNEHYPSIKSARTLVAGGDIRSLANDGTLEQFTDGNSTVVIQTRAALHEFTRNCGAEYIYGYDDNAWTGGKRERVDSSSPENRIEL